MKTLPEAVAAMETMAAIPIKFITRLTKVPYGTAVAWTDGTGPRMGHAWLVGDTVRYVAARHLSRKNCIPVFYPVDAYPVLVARWFLEHREESEDGEEPARTYRFAQLVAADLIPEDD